MKIKIVTVLLYFLSIVFVIPYSMAKSYNYDNTVAGIEVNSGGLLKLPRTNLSESPQTVGSNYPIQYGGGIVISIFSKILLRPTFEYIQFPEIGVSANRDSDNAPYSQKTTSYVTSYQLKVSLVGFQSSSKKMRLYFGGGYGRATLRAVRTRTIFTSNRTFAERSDAKGTFTSLHVGMGYFMTQNYSMSIEYGYRKIGFDSIVYRDNKDVNGDSISGGSPALSEEGDKTHFYAGSPYIQLGLQINF